MDLEKEESIDLGKLWQVTKAHKKVVASIIVGYTAIATIVAFSLLKQYASTTLVQTRSAGVKLSSQTEAKPGDKGNYMELMKSRTVLNPIIDELYEGKDSAKKPDAAAFAKSNLDIKNTKGTNLITVTAKGRTPEEAQKISKEVVDNFLAMQADNSQQSQNLYVQLFDERIEDVKRDYDDAAQKLADFSSKHGLYSLDSQLQQESANILLTGQPPISSSRVRQRPRRTFTPISSSSARRARYRKPWSSWTSRSSTKPTCPKPRALRKRHSSPLSASSSAASSPSATASSCTSAKHKGEVSE